MNLSEWQIQFSQLIKGQACEAAPSTEAQAARVAVYQRGFWQRLSGSLMEDFPLTYRLLGRDLFLELVHAFLDVERGFQPDLGEVSDVFAAYVRSTMPGTPAARAAHLDLQRVHAALAPETPPSGHHFGLHPSARLLADGERFYVTWRVHRYVERRRVTEAAYQLILGFDPPADLATITDRLSELALEPEFVKEMEEWSSLGLLTQR